VSCLRKGRWQRSTTIGWSILACAGLGFASYANSSPFVVWNTSASAPIGLYGVRNPGILKRGDLVLVRLPAEARRLASERGYLPANVPAIKRVAALPGDKVCVGCNPITVNGERRAVALTHDARGRPLAPWMGCEVLSEGEIFLLNDAPASFDGRYFGPSLRADVLGILAPLWVF
jgi:conjugative transfer signal peptidase TraF